MFGYHKTILIEVQEAQKKAARCFVETFDPMQNQLSCIGTMVFDITQPIQRFNAISWGKNPFWVMLWHKLLAFIGFICQYLLAICFICHFLEKGLLKVCLLWEWNQLQLLLSCHPKRGMSILLPSILMFVYTALALAATITSDGRKLSLHSMCIYPWCAAERAFLESNCGIIAFTTGNHY